MENLAAVALEAASRVHQRTQASYRDTKSDTAVLNTADAFYEWLRDKSL